MSLTINIPGATPEELQRGIRAASDVFVSAGVTPQKAAEAHFDAGWIVRGFPGPPTTEITRLADLWDAADAAAVAACCAGWSAKPDTARLAIAER